MKCPSTGPDDRCEIRLVRDPHELPAQEEKRISVKMRCLCPLAGLQLQRRASGAPGPEAIEPCPEPLLRQTRALTALSPPPPRAGQSSTVFNQAAIGAMPPPGPIPAACGSRAMDQAALGLPGSAALAMDTTSRIPHSDCEVISPRRLRVMTEVWNRIVEQTDGRHGVDTRHTNDRAPQVQIASTSDACKRRRLDLQKAARTGVSASIDD